VSSDVAYLQLLVLQEMRELDLLQELVLRLA
jgi:hypothetical protein